MSTKLIAKVLGVAVVTVFVVAGAVAPAQAATVAELQAMIAQLQSQIAALSGGSSASALTSNLTVGSTGAEVTALQNFLASKGYLSATARGYFGALTKAALAAYQTANGISPAAGYFGPVTRAAVNAAMGSTGGTVSSGTVSTAGAEGTLTITKGAVSNTTLYEGDSNIPVLSLKAKATASDIAIERIKLNLGTNTSIYTKVYSALAVVGDDGRVLTKVALNSDSVVKDGSNYTITLTGFKYVVAKGTSRYFTINADVYPSVNSTYQGSKTITLVTDAVRGIDGAGIDQYGGDTTISQAVSVGTSLVDSASLTVSTDSATVKAGSVIAKDGTTKDQADKVNILTFDVRATNADVKIVDLHASTTITTTATLANAYLYDGSTLLGSATVANNTADFTDINYVVPKDVTRALTIKVDVRTADTNSDNLTAAVLANGVTAENMQGTSASVTGSATSNTLVVRKLGPVVSLGGITIGSVGRVTDNAGNATSTVAVTFNVNLTALGGDIVFGSTASGTPMLSASLFDVYVDGAKNITGIAATTSNFSVPSSGVVNDSTNNTFTLQENNSTTIPVTFNLTVAKEAGPGFTGATSPHSYAVGINKVNWFSTTTSANYTFMAGNTDWRSANVTLP
ncbi:peptidoglycan-binding protein [Candidatus Nomurabacteria bacterium]|nr:peptidoglycan-binding protein [Candidatus Nomurabacteria bacterium]